MKSLVTLMSISLGIGFVVALANAEDTTTKESTYESSQITKQLPGTTDTTSTGTTANTGSTDSNKTSCTDANGVMHPSSDKQAFNDCLNATKQKKTGDMGGQVAPASRPSPAHETTE